MPFRPDNFHAPTPSSPGGGAPSGPAFGSTPVASGDSMVGETLGWSDLGDPTGYDTLEYVWKRDGVAIEGEIASTYTLTGDDLDCVITGEINLTGGAGANFTQEWPYVVAEFSGMARWIDYIDGSNSNDGSALRPYQSLDAISPEMPAVDLTVVFITGTTSDEFTAETPSAMRLLGASPTLNTITSLGGIAHTTTTLVVHSLNIGAINYVAPPGTNIWLTGNELARAVVGSFILPAPTVADTGGDGADGSNSNGGVGAAGDSGTIGSPDGGGGGVGEYGGSDGSGGNIGGAGSSAPCITLDAVALSEYVAPGGDGGAGGSGGSGGAASAGAGGAGGTAYDEAALPPADLAFYTPDLDDSWAFSYTRNGAFGTKNFTVATTDPNDGNIWLDSSGWTVVTDMRAAMVDALNTAGASAVASGDNVVCSYSSAGSTTTHSGGMTDNATGSVSGGGSGADAVPHNGGDGGDGGGASANGGDGGDGGAGGNGGHVYLTNGATCITNSSPGGAGGAGGTGGTAGSAGGGAGGIGGNGTNGGSSGNSGTGGSSTATSGAGGNAGSGGNAGGII